MSTLGSEIGNTVRIFDPMAYAASLLVIVIARSALDFVARLCTEVLAKRIERDTRDELYVSLLGKSQTFHNRQRVGDIMARAANDTSDQLRFPAGPDAVALARRKCDGTGL